VVGVGGEGGGVFVSLLVSFFRGGGGCVWGGGVVALVLYLCVRGSEGLWWVGGADGGGGQVCKALGGGRVGLGGGKGVEKGKADDQTGQRREQSAGLRMKRNRKGHADTATPMSSSEFARAAKGFVPTGTKGGGTSHWGGKNSKKVKLPRGKTQSYRNSSRRR